MLLVSRCPGPSPGPPTDNAAWPGYRCFGTARPMTHGREACHRVIVCLSEMSLLLDEVRGEEG
jgi:hypothetical protein